jgi:hypothetical protein
MGRKANSVQGFGGEEMTDIEQAVQRMAAEMDKAFCLAASGPAPALLVAPKTNPADSKRQWLEANPDFKYWRPQGLLSLSRWKDVGWVTNEGRFIPEGDDRFYGGLHLNSHGDTLYVVPAGASKVGREYSTIC